MGRRESSQSQGTYVISVAAELAGVHPQTLRVYERKGLLAPYRTRGNTRRYSDRDIQLLRRIQELTHEGINLAGVTKILELEEELEDLKNKHREALEDLEQLETQLQEAMEGGAGFPLVPFKDVRRVRRALKADVIERAGRRRIFAAPPVHGQESNKKR